MFDLHTLIAEILETIPLSRAMAIEGLRYDGQELLLQLPLAPNINDKGCAFGGSLASAATLTGWGLARLAIGESGRRADIYIQDQSLRYGKPAWGATILRCAWPAGAKQAFLDQYDRHGKARIAVEVFGSSEDIECCSMSARYVALQDTKSFSTKNAT
jgi:thioesterase domain-containing protein